MPEEADIVAQFTRTADAFASAPQIVDRRALDLLLEQTEASPSDDSLDVACGAGVVACHFASVVRTAAGIDITPAMIARASSRQRDRGLGNLTWALGDVKHLPYADESFSIVTSRYAFHHMAEPEAVLREMVRVAKPGGVVAVADICVSEDARKADRFNQLERENDPTHVRALPLSEHRALFQRVDLAEPRVARYTLDIPLSRLLEAAGRSPDEARAVQARVQAAIEDDMLGTDSRLDGQDIMFSYPIAVLSARKPAGPPWAA